MKRTTLGFLFILFASGLFAQKVALLTDSWEPYTSDKMSGNGAVTELIMAAFKEAKIETSLTFVPWKRCESEVLAGTAFATFPYMVTDDRKQAYDFSDSILTTKGKIYYWEGRGTDVAWTTYKDFGAVTWGGYPGNWYVEEFKKQGIKFEPAANLDLVLKMLQAGRIDYFIEDELVCMIRAKEVLGADLGKLRAVTKLNNESALNLLVSRKYAGTAGILAKFNAGLASIKKNGTYATITAKYGLK